MEVLQDRFLTKGRESMPPCRSEVQEVNDPMPAHGVCPPMDDLKRLLADELSADAERTLQSHLEGCTTCQQALERLAGAGPSWDRAARHLRNPGNPTEAALAQAVADLQITDHGSGTPIGDETQGDPRLDVADEFAYLDPPTEEGHLGRLAHYEIVEVVEFIGNVEPRIALGFVAD